MSLHTVAIPQTVHNQRIFGVLVNSVYGYKLSRCGIILEQKAQSEIVFPDPSGVYDQVCDLAPPRIGDDRVVVGARDIDVFTVGVKSSPWACGHDERPLRTVAFDPPRCYLLFDRLIPFSVPPRIRDLREQRDEYRSDYHTARDRSLPPGTNPRSK